MKNEKSIKNPFENVSFNDFDGLKNTPKVDAAKRSTKNFTIAFFHEDFEFFKDWIYHMRTIKQDPSFTQQEGMKILLQNIKTIYKDVQERPQHIKDREKKGRGKSKLQTNP